MRASEAFIAATGGPEVIQWREVDLAPPAAGEVLVAHEAVGLNFIDTYQRSGLYPAPLPAALGSEAAGVVVAVGAGVADFHVGDKVAGFGPRRGAYATARLYRAEELFLLPDDISTHTAAAALLKGCTVEYLAERTARLQPGDWALVHAAAGGVGQILVQWLVAMGVRVIATVGSAPKADIARGAGAQAVFLADADGLAETIRGVTGGKGVRVVYDGVGAATWALSLAVTAPRGLIASFGNASGPVTGVNLGVLASAGSLYVTRPTLFSYYAEPAERAAGAGRLWAMIRSGAVKIAIGQSFALRDVAAAHRALEERATTGSSLLLV